MQRAFGLNIPQTLDDVCDPTRLALVVYDVQVGIVKQIENGRSQVYVFPLTGERKPYPFAASGFIERSGHFSPDGHWLAYISRESGKDEVYVAPFPGPGGKWQVSSAGGKMPRWRRDGREIFFVSEDNTLMAAEVEGREKNFDVKKVRPLFRANFAPEVFERLGTYDVAGDGSRFLINTNDQPASPISLVLRWPADLK
jgi:dipeptidyl aminopeptidase/acylaminoacyl peptidase